MTGGSNQGFLYKVRQALRLKISARILIMFLFIALVPIVVVSFVLVSAANDQLLQNASDKQQAVATDLAQRVDNYLALKINSLAYIARLYSNHSLSSTQIDQSFVTLFNQTSNLNKVTLLEANGASGMQRTITFPDDKPAYKNEVIDTSPAILKFIENKSYLISVGRDGKNNPIITIGIPILKKYGLPQVSQFASESGTTDNLIGAIAADYNISDLWQSVLSTKIGNGGYAYVVDGEGNLVTHPDRKFLDSHRELTSTPVVHQFLSSNSETKQTISETNQQVISTPHKTVTGWAVIVEEPVTSIYASVNSYIQLAITVGFIAIIVSIMAGVFFSKQLIRPIKALSLGAKRMEQGEFDQTINVKTKDELQDLAEAFNGMAQSIKKLVGDMKTNNMRLKFEQIKLNNIISSVSDGVIAVNGKGEIVSINPPAALLVNQLPDKLEGRVMNDEFRFEHDDARFTPDLKNGGIYRYPDLTLNRGDSIAYLDMMVAVLQHPDSDVAAIITVHDQTASRELSFMKLDFVAIAAHELRTPLTVVRGYLDMLNSGDAIKGLSVYDLENLQKAIVGADQLRELINKLLNIARIERGDMEIFIEKLNLTKLVHDNVDQHVAVAAQKQQTLTLNDMSDSTIYTPADTASIVEVLNNLIGNALKYTPKGGKIQVNLTVDEDTARVEVTDDGPGVPEELRDRLFTKFYRAERSLISGTRGTGLGLFISKTIIELQSGKIGIEPDEGKGSTFYFTLPVYNAERDDELIAKKSSGGIRGWFKKHPSR
jgi:signal transduction histidine kinase